MPQKCQPDRLERLSLKAVGEWIKLVGRDLMEPIYTAIQHDPNQGLLLLHNLVGLVRNTLYSSTACYLYDQMAHQVLTAIEELINEIECSQPITILINEKHEVESRTLDKIKVVASLSEVVMHSQLKCVDLCRWPKPIRHVLNKNLHLLKGVEYLNLASGTSDWEMAETEKYFLSGVTLMSKLTTFCLNNDCTDDILLALGNNCPALQCVYISDSRSVTDRGIPCLINCKKLKEVKLFQTQVTILGYKDLLSSLPYLQDIGRCDDFGKVLQNLHEDKCGPLSLIYLHCKDMTLKQRQLLGIYCPKLSSVSIVCHPSVPDLTFLSILENLEVLEIKSCNFYSYRVKDLFKKVGMNLISILFHSVVDIDLNGLKYISQLCPNLRKISFINCRFSDHYSMRYNSPNDHNAQFACLEQLVCNSHCSMEQVEFLLMNCHNIKFIYLESSIGINDSTIKRVLEKNPMSKLEELQIPYSSCLSMESVNLLMDCEQLHTLSGLESWESITTEQLKSFEEYLRYNNLELDIFFG